MSSHSIKTQHNKKVLKCPRKTQLIAWVNIITQIAFPLAGAFTPMMAGAGSDRHFLASTDGRAPMPTKVYTLSSGESTESVAKKYNIPLSELRQLNQLRTFSHGFNHLQPGDELDVPYAPLSTITWDKHNNVAVDASGTLSDDVKNQKLAGMASQVGTYLSQSPNGDAAASMARGMASGAASSEIQQWLSRFGTARVQLDTNKNFSLKNSQFDLLVPLYEQKDRLVFTQASLHRTDDRTQSNLGMGYRWFSDTWMLGGNTFLDYDLSRDHARMGLGLEYWRDFLKLGINGYQRLTNWKNSPDVTDYEERPANGWDVRAQAWLPVLPQLGGKLTYEQYYGQEVGLFGKDNRQRDPHAITAGITYTPVPIITLSAEQRQGKSSENDTRFGVDMNYQLGVPWQQQINPDAVAVMRSLAGNRYDLVERNNNTVLEYRKKEVIRLKTADLVTGYAGEQKSLEVSVTSKYGLEHIDWSASALIAAGGKILQSGSGWAVVMPAYRSGAGGVNSYTVSGVAVDKKGNVSSRADTQVTVTQAAIDTTTSSLSPPIATLPADGGSQQEFVLKVNDKEGHPVDIAEKEISIDKTSKLRGSSRATVSAFTRRAAGEYVMKVTAGTMPEAFTLTPSARNVHFASANVTLRADNTTALVDALDVIENNAIADGQSQNRLRVTVVDAQNNPVHSQPVILKADNGASVAGTAITESDGTVIVPVTSQHAGETTITASINDKGSKTLKLSFRPDQNTAKVKGRISAAPAAATVGDSVTYTAVLTDANENALGADIPVTWSANEGSTLSSQVTRTDNSGTARVTLTRALVGTAKVELILPSGATAAPDVIFSAGDVDENRSKLTLSPSVIVAGKETATLTLTLRDSNGNLLAGKSVSGYSDNNNVNIGESQENSNAPGRYAMTVTSDKAGSAILTTKVGNITLNKSRTLTVKGDTDSWKLSTVRPDKTRLVAGDAKGVTYSTTVIDVQGNPLTNVVVSWQLSGQAESYEPTSRTNEKGVATNTVKSHTAGQLQMTAYLDADNHMQADNVTVVAGEIKNATFGADKTRIGSDGKDTVKLTASLEDSYGNPVTGKTVAIEGADSLADFKLSQVQDQQNGNYVATGTATAKGSVTLNAQVGGTTVGNPVTVSVGAITPDLRFDNTEQPVTWTRSFTASQTVRGMPEGVEQKWSSSNTSVATVDGNGKVTLLKAGSVRVSVYTPGNEQYNQAMASYTLNVSKANPGLEAGTGDPITAVWADGKERNITVTYTNSDVQNELTATYATKDTSVVSIEKTGKLMAVKPGTTTVTVSTPETDQFLAASADVAYVLNKATADVSFDTPVIKTTDEDAFTLQKSVTTLTSQASIKWTSSNTNVVNISSSGAVQGDVGKGQTRLTLTVLANDYYNASSGYYDVMVYTKPSISLGDVSYISKGNKGSSGTWTPVFTDDTLTVTWSADASDGFSKPESVTVYILDSNDNVLASKEQQSPSGSKTTTVNPDTNLWGKTVHVRLVAKGYGNLESSKISSTIIVNNLTPNQIWTSFTVRSHVETVTANGTDDACKETAFGRYHWNNAVATGDSINFSGKKLISPMSVRARVSSSQNGSDTSGPFPTSYNTVSSNQSIQFGKVKIADDCWRDHRGGYTVGVVINYSDKEFSYWASESHGWGGNSDGMYVDRVDKF